MEISQKPSKIVRRVANLSWKRDRFLSKLQFIEELVDEYQQTGTHNVNSLKVYKENIKEEWDRIWPVLDELNDRGKELEAFNTCLTLQFRLIKLMEGEQLPNPSRSIGSEAFATTVHILEIRLPTFDGTRELTNQPKPIRQYTTRGHTQTAVNALHASTTAQNADPARSWEIGGRPSIKNISEADRRCEEQVRDNAQRTSEGQSIVDLVTPSGKTLGKDQPLQLDTNVEIVTSTPKQTNNKPKDP
jgi:hypothetical protein